MLVAPVRTLNMFTEPVYFGFQKFAVNSSHGYIGKIQFEMPQTLQNIFSILEFQ
jgi:hypothetical protein